MTRATALLLLSISALWSAPAASNDGAEWDEARARTYASQRSAVAAGIDRWKLLSANDRYSFYDYTSYLLAFPGFPEEAKIRGYAERALDREGVDASRLIAFFDRFRPLTNPARAQYALALSAANRPGARDMAAEAWRGGAMSDSAMLTLKSLHGASFTPADHDARMDALLWAGSLVQAQQQLELTSPAMRGQFAARLALIGGAVDPAYAASPSADLMRDPGYVYNRIRQLRRAGSTQGVISLLASRPPLARPPLDQTKWVAELLSAARSADAANAVRIASSIDDAFVPGTDVSRTAFKLRDDYTSLMWLGGTRALNQLGDGARASALFYRYGAAARTPQTRSKGFYWAGRAMATTRDAASAARYFEMAAAYPDHFYGLLSLERLGRPLPSLNNAPAGVASAAERAAFAAKPITHAVREAARDYDWPTTVRFFREISDQAESEGEHLLVADLARTTGRRDLAVILGQSAHTDGFGNFQTISFPLIPVPPGSSWTMVHAITRQESQFSMNAVSHAGARGLMQLMPGTAREQAGKLGMGYDPGALTRDAGYNIRLGDGYFARMMDYYGGSYPLAVAAYNAGPGNVNKWLRSNGDPRYSGQDWIEWIEHIPLQETRNYVQRVLENAVVYEAMNPARATYRGVNPLSHFLGKRGPG